ncbi:glycoside hydrolase family 47 protein [Rhizoctonia solani]|uniref:alpha-1,2-Mannosidase n=1 Tax=Rhizoctonia solani TaxID=456999 RepID=A0A8H8T2I9_9AGAM|nr:glycoside hydrolase family 47 protein [Rhizoctonia solani]QRW25887.1 glycoside hydrolase family 47 protein [Rhizoctonia solani]
MSLPLPTQTDSKPGFSLQALKSRAVVSPRARLASRKPIWLATPSTWDPDFDPPPPPPHEAGAPVKPPVDTVMADRAEAVRNAFRHAYSGYTNAAWNYDELLPTSNGSTNNFNGWGVSVIDAISTMQLMGLKSEYDGALDFVTKMNFDINNDGHARFSRRQSGRFQPRIIAANAHSNAYAGREHILLQKAALLADKLLPVFDSPSGLPFFGVRTSGPPPVYPTDDPKSYKYSTASDNAPGARLAPGGSAPLAEFASCQMELKYLSWATGQARYFLAAERVMDVMKKAAPNLPLPGLFPIWWERTNGTPVGDKVSLGAMADSGFEYLLKQYLLTGRTETALRDLWLQASDSIISHMLFISPNRKLLYVTDIASPAHTPAGKLEHLSCFLPGLFALGADQLTEKEGMTKERKERYMWAAIGLTNTCIGVYEDMQTGLGAEIVQFQTQNPKWIDELTKWEQTRKPGDLPPGVTSKWTRLESDQQRDYYVSDARWLSRPEGEKTLESVFLLWRTTKDPVWRERGWAAFQAIEKYSKTKYGYGSVTHVDNKAAAAATDSQPSYFLAETLKYLFLLFSDDSALPLDKFIFNTEAHPLGVWKWRDWEMKKYNIH